MKGHRWWIAAVVLAFGFTSNGVVQAQDGEDALRFTDRQPAVGARALGFGGAGTAGIGDLSAMYTNPAGLAYLKQSVFVGGLGMFRTQDDAVYQLPGVATGRTNDVWDTALDHVAYAHRVPTRRGSMVVSAGLHRVHSFSRELFFEGSNGLNSATDFFMPVSGEFDIAEDPGNDGILGTADDVLSPTFTRDLSFIGFEAYAIDIDFDLYDRYAAGENISPFFPAVTAGTVEQSGLVSEEGNMHEFSFGGAFEASRGVLAGLTVNIPFGKWEFTSRFDELDANNDNDGTGGTVDFDGLTWTETIDSRLAGINLRAGASIEASEDLRIGFTVETPTFYSISEDFATFVETRFDDGFIGEYGFDVGETVGAGGFDYEIRTPWRLGAGILFRTGSLTLLGDAEFIDWTQLELNSDGYAFTLENQEISRNLNQVINSRLGAEYGLGDFVLRAGVGFRPDPRDIQPGLTTDLNTVDRDRTIFSAGFSYMRGDQFALDFGWSQDRFDDRYSPYTEVADAPLVQEEILRDRLTFGLRVFIR